ADGLSLLGNVVSGTHERRGGDSRIAALRKGSETGGEHNGSESGQGPRALLRAVARSPAGTFPALRIQFSGNHKLSQKNSARTTVMISSPPPPEDHRRPARWHTLCEG